MSTARPCAPTGHACATKAYDRRLKRADDRARRKLRPHDRRRRRVPSGGRARTASASASRREVAVDTAPDSVDQGWCDQVAAYFTFGPGETAGVWILTILGIVLMVGAIVAWFYVEDQKMKAQVAAAPRESGLKTETMPGGEAHHTRPGGLRCRRQIDFPPEQKEPKVVHCVLLAPVRGLHRPGRDHQQRVTSGGPQEPAAATRPARPASAGARASSSPSPSALALAVGAFLLAREQATEPPGLLGVGAQAPPLLAGRPTTARRSRCRPPPGGRRSSSFLETGCGSCREEAPVLAELARGGAERRWPSTSPAVAAPSARPLRRARTSRALVPLAAGRRSRRRGLSRTRRADDLRPARRRHDRGRLGRPRRRRSASSAHWPLRALPGGIWTCRHVQLHVRTSRLTSVTSPRGRPRAPSSGGVRLALGAAG